MSFNGKEDVIEYINRLWDNNMFLQKENAKLKEQILYQESPNVQHVKISHKGQEYTIPQICSKLDHLESMLSDKINKGIIEYEGAEFNPFLQFYLISRNPFLMSMLTQSQQKAVKFMTDILTSCDKEFFRILQLYSLVGKTLYEIRRLKSGKGFINDVEIVGLHLADLVGYRNLPRKEYFIVRFSGISRHIPIDKLGVTIFTDKSEALRVLGIES